ncbi:MAG TPA: thioredoxin-disulfide reductase [Thermoplasmata archaeon]|nr:thioredoxin-disulfide reductase [Thermoplasmata archaeon]HIH29665.1 thioredoxin-disulfide reductase [Thermoplasmata archaeon]
MDYELAIIGAGPAGFSAAIYAKRSGISTIVFDRGGGGGLLQVAPNIENYVGFDSILGMDLVEKMKQHATKYADFHFYEEVKDVESASTGFLITTGKASYQVGAVILCTGTEHKKLDVPGESEFIGKGVSYCATCDGFFFKGKRVVVVGGGNTALIESIFLKQLGCKEVHVVHRREQFRAEKVYEEEAREKGVHFHFNTLVEEIKGKDRVTSVNLFNLQTSTRSTLPVEGVFASVGVLPQNEIARTLQLKTDDNGYIIVDSEQRTSLRGVYAAGDITGGLRQVVTACAKGAVAALSSTEVLGKKYPY